MNLLLRFVISFFVGSLALVALLCYLYTLFHTSWVGDATLIVFCLFVFTLIANSILFKNGRSRFTKR